MPPLDEETLKLCHLPSDLKSTVDGSGDRYAGGSGVRVGVGVPVTVGVPVRVGVAVCVPVAVGVGVAVGVAVAVGVGVAVRESLNIDDNQDYSAREHFPAKTFKRDGYDWVVNSLVFFSEREMAEIEKMACGFDRRLPVGYPDVDIVRKIGSESRRKEDVRSLRHALREKAVRYLPIPDGIGDVPLIIAVNDYDSGLVVDELLGTRAVDVWEDLDIALPAPRGDNGFWRRSAQSKRRHVKAVWHFERARSDNPDFRAKLILNPDEGNAWSILPKQLFFDPHTEVVWQG